MRAVLDPNALISAVLSATGAPARAVERWLDGEFELIVSEHLLAELGSVLSYPKIRERVSPAEADELVATLRAGATAIPDPRQPPARSLDPGDDYLIALAAEAGAALVSGDRHVLALSGKLPVYSARAFLELLDTVTP